MSLHELKQQLEAKKDEKADIEEEMLIFESELEEHETVIDGYDSLLDDCSVDVGGIEFEKSYILKTLDPIAYDEGLRDYVDSLNLSDFPEYKELEEKKDEIEDEITDLENKIEDLEEEE